MASNQGFFSQTAENNDSYEQDEVPEPKRQRTGPPYASHLEWTPERIKDTINAFVTHIDVDGLPFNTYSRSPFCPGYKLLFRLNPVFVTKYFPTVQDLAGKHLDSLFETTRATVKGCVQRALKSGFCSLILNGWDDGGSAQVVNVLVRAAGSCDASRKTFFLKSVYTDGIGRKSPETYVCIIESIMQEYGSMKGISSVTSDMSSTCFRVKEALIEKYPHLIGVNDQRSACNRLISNIRRLPWISNIIIKVIYIMRKISRRPKLMRRLRSMLESQNELGKKSQSTPDKNVPTVQKRDASKDNVETNNMSVAGAPPSDSEDTLEKVLPSFWRCGKRNTFTFVVTQELIDAFLLSLTALRELVKQPDFGKLLPRRHEREQSQKETEGIVSLINDTNFEGAVRDVQKLMFLLDTYGRNFDEDTVHISEVLPPTLDLEKKLEEMPITKFFNDERKIQGMKLFKRLKYARLGEKNEVQLLENVHFAAYLLNPHLAPDVPGVLMVHFRAHARTFAASKKVPDVDSFVTRLVLSYLAQHANWIRSRVAGEEGESLSQYKGDALLWWNAGLCDDPELCEFAFRTLSCSPKAFKVESINYWPQKPLRHRERESLLREKVQKMLFCRWNIKMMCSGDSFTKDDFLVSVRETIRAIASVQRPKRKSTVECILNVYLDQGRGFGGVSDTESDSESDTE